MSSFVPSERRHNIKQFFQRNVFPANNISMPYFTALHGKNQASCNIAHIDEIKMKSR